MSGMSRRRYFGGIAVAAGGLLAAACDPGAGPTVTTQRKAAVTIRVLTTPDAPSESLDAIWQEIGARFAEEQPHLTLERHDFGVLGAPWDQRPLHELIRELVAAGELADVFQTITTLTGLYFTEGALLSLSDYAKRDSYDLTDYWPAALTAAQWQGELLALPIEVSPKLLYCNEELFARAGVPIPAQAWSWEDFLAAARKLTHQEAAEPVYGFTPFSAFDYVDTLPWLWGNGGAMFSADLSRSQVAQPEAQAALQWFADLGLAHQVTPRADTLDGTERLSLFVAGRAAMFSFSWVLPGEITDVRLQAPRFRYVAVEPPRGPIQPASSTVLGGYHIARATEVPDEAWTFLAWWTGAAAQHWYRTSSSWSTRADPPARRSLATELADRYGAAALAALCYARHVPLHPQLSDLLDVYDAGLQPVWTGEQSVATATAEVARRQNELLAKGGP